MFYNEAKGKTYIDAWGKKRSYYQANMQCERAVTKHLVSKGVDKITANRISQVVATELSEDNYYNRSVEVAYQSKYGHRADMVGF